MTGKYFCYQCQCLVSVIPSSTNSQFTCIHNSRHAVEKISEQDDWFYDPQSLETQGTTSTQLFGQLEQDQFQDSYIGYCFYSGDEHDMDAFIQAANYTDDLEDLVNGVDTRAFGLNGYSPDNSITSNGVWLINGSTNAFVAHDDSDWSLGLSDGGGSESTEYNNNSGNDDSILGTFLDQDDDNRGRHMTRLERIQQNSRERFHHLDTFLDNMQGTRANEDDGNLHDIQQHIQNQRRNQQRDGSTTDQLRKSDTGDFEKLPIRLLSDDDLLVKSRIDCVICQEPYKSGVSLIKMPCNHEYHKECLLQWLDHSPTCPVCRGSLKCSRPIVCLTSHPV